MGIGFENREMLSVLLVGNSFDNRSATPKLWRVGDVKKNINTTRRPLLKRVPALDGQDID